MPALESLYGMHAESHNNWHIQLLEYSDNSQDLRWHHLVANPLASLMCVAGITPPPLERPHDAQHHHRRTLRTTTAADMTSSQP